MRKKILFLISSLFLISNNTFAETERSPVFEASYSEEVILDKQQNHFPTSIDYKIAPKVNPITGEYCEEETDLIVAGACPLSVRRFYNSKAPYDPRYAHWRYNPECFFVANFEWPEQEIFASLGEADGSICSFSHPCKERPFFQFTIPKNFLFIPTEGSSHPLNTTLHYKKIPHNKHKQHYHYEGIITDGTGRKRFFSSESHPWTHSIKWTERKKGFGWFSDTTWLICPNTWTPYHLPITEERLPNGNLLCYTYLPWKKESYPLPQLLHTLTAYNSDKSHVLGFIHFHYTKDKDDNILSIQITGSDGRSAFLKHSGTPGKLSSASSPGKPSLTYAYEDKGLCSLALSRKEILKTEYNSEGKVVAQYAPLGPQGENVALSRYIYEDFMTQVFDAEGRRTDYHFDAHKRLLSIVSLDNYSIYKRVTFEREASTGNLIRKTLLDKNEQPVFITEYTYDKNHNPIEERYGFGSEWRVIKRTFSEDGFNLKLTETDREGKLIQYNYLPGTNLLSSEFVYDKETLRQRTFYTYDNCALCIKTIIDDGCTEDPYNLTGVTFRKITAITPKYSLPCFGLPEVIEEKTLNDQGEEVLLSKRVLSYTPFGAICQEDYYDSLGVYRYSLYNTYDDQERLICKTDPLGYKTFYTYDIYNNVTSIRGPREDQYQEIFYDKAHRPCQFIEYLDRDTPLITEKKYNKCGQVIEERAPSGQRTQFIYDSQGRPKEILYPEGQTLYREYDLFDNVIKEQDLHGDETLKTYNPFGQVISIHYADGTQESFSYHPTGTLASHTDKKGVTTKTTYDIFDHPILCETYDSLGNLVNSKKSTWSPFCLLSETEEALTSTFTYDYAGRKIKETQGDLSIDYSYDSLGRVCCERSLGIERITEYDLKGAPLHKRVEYQGQIQSQESFLYEPSGRCIAQFHSQGKTTFSYDPQGKLLSKTDPLGFTTFFTYTYTPFFTKISLNPQGVQTETTYNSQGKEILRIKKNSQGEIIQKTETVYKKKSLEVTHTLFSGSTPLKTLTHIWEYGPLGRIEKFIEAGQRETLFFYNSQGQLKTLVKPEGLSLNYEYDSLARVQRFFSSDFDYRYTYDSKDRILEVFEALSKTKTVRNYDPLGNVLQETLGNGLSLSTTYDLLNRKTASLLPNHSSIHYHYHGLYLASVSKDSLHWFYTKRNLEGQCEELKTPIGSISTKKDPLGRTLSLHSPYFSSYNYTYDPLGNLLHYTYEDPLGKKSCDYTYDSLSQLIQEEGHSYAYDSLYNRREKEGVPLKKNSFEQTLYAPEITYTYDASGNLLSENQKIYTYDSLNRLISVEKGSFKESYTYDAFNRRLSKTSYLNNFPLKTVRYLWDMDNEIGLVDEQGNFLELRVLAEGLGAEIGASLLFELYGKEFVPLHDHRGCVVTLIDLETHSPAATYRYTAFGEESLEGILSPWRFSSKRTEKTGWVYFGRRYYSPFLGQWTSQDPKGFEEGPNLYAYVYNSPLTSIDPYGLSTSFLCLPLAFYPLSQETLNSLLQQSLENFPGDPLLSKGNRIVSLPGKKILHHRIAYTNGILTSIEEALSQASFISQTHGNTQVDLIYHQTQGFVKDIFNVASSKIGRMNSFNKLQSSYFINKLKEDPHCYFTSFNHSRGALQIMKSGTLLEEWQRKRISVYAFGPAKLIPKHYFKSAKNYVSQRDFISLFADAIGYAHAFRGDLYEVIFLKPSSYSPLTEHTLLGPTYSQAIKKLGNEFIEKHFHE